MDSIIVARKLTKIYRTDKTRIKALAGVDLDVAPGEFIAIVGTSGSGKSTLLSLLAGLEKPSAGRVAIKGHGIHRMSEKQLVDFRLKNTGFVFQNYNLMGVLTAQENTAFPLLVQGKSRKESMYKAKELLMELGLSGHLHHRPGQLSGGQQQRVSIARAIITEPEIVFADEPTGNLDSESADRIIDLLSDISKKRSKTVLMVTHDQNRVRCADRIVHLKDGRIDSSDAAIC